MIHQTRLFSCCKFFSQPVFRFSIICCGVNFCYQNVIRAALSMIFFPHRLHIFPSHCFFGNHPLLPIFAGIYAIYQFSIGDCLAQCTFVQSLKLCGICKGHQSVEWCLYRFTIRIQLITGLLSTSLQVLRRDCLSEPYTVCGKVKFISVSRHPACVDLIYHR